MVLQGSGRRNRPGKSNWLRGSTKGSVEGSGHECKVRPVSVVEYLFSSQVQECACRACVCAHQREEDKTRIGIFLE